MCRPSEQAAGYERFRSIPRVTGALSRSLSRSRHVCSLDPKSLCCLQQIEGLDPKSKLTGAAQVTLTEAEVRSLRRDMQEQERLIQGYQVWCAYALVCRFSSTPSLGLFCMHFSTALLHHSKPHNIYRPAWLKQYVRKLLKLATLSQGHQPCCTFNVAWHCSKFQAPAT